MDPITWRSIRNYGQVRDDATPGCPDRFDVTFCRWVWDYERKRRPEMDAQMREHAHRLPVIWRSTPREVSVFLREIGDRLRQQEEAGAA